eukprot:GFUD01034200.1.p1 GENE.GFUD01034200.1~~GFUD01034200.1.p1  ORF type:complete len:783 (-),score=145.03 GFUD01034200.1:63-2114(-)
MKEFGEIRNTSHEKESSQLHLNNYSGPRLIPNSSLVLKFPYGKKSDCDDLHIKLEDLRKNASAEIERGSDHEDHDCMVFKDEIEDSSESMQHSSCKDCGKLFLGKLQTGIKCNTCNALFHKECFAINKEDDYGEQEEEFDDPEDLLIVKTDSMQDFYLGPMDRNKAKKMLQPKRRGTFLVRLSKGRYVISKKLHRNDSSTKEYDCLVVQPVTLDNTEWFYLEKGFAFKDIYDLINEHRKSHFLYFPINTPESAFNDRNSSTESLQTKAEEPSAAQNIPILTVEEPTDAVFLHGAGEDISKEEAEERLKNKRQGTFLVRHSKGAYKISLVLSNGIVKHIVIHESEGSFSLTNQKKFQSLTDLVQNYMNVTPDHKYLLGQPLENPNLVNNDSNRTDDDLKFERDLSRRKEPLSLQFFHGSLKSGDATKMLLAEPTGTFLLRSNEDDEYRITYKKENKVQHLRIHFRDSIYYTRGSEDKPFSSLRRLVDHLKEDMELFSIPLKSSIQERKTTRFTSIWSQPENNVSVSPSPQSFKDREKNQSNFSSPVAGPSGKNRWQNQKENSFQNESSEEDELEGRESCKSSDEHFYENVEHDALEKYPCSGVMSNGEADALLEDRPVGSWILRINESGKKRISVKSPKKIMHIPVYEDGGLFCLTLGDLKRPIEELLQILEAQGTLGVQLTVF